MRKAFLIFTLFTIHCISTHGQVKSNTKTKPGTKTTKVATPSWGEIKATPPRRIPASAPAAPKELIRHLDLYALSNRSEREMIRALDSLYPNSKAPDLDMSVLMRDKKFEAVKHLVTQFEVTPAAEHLSQLNASGVQDAAMKMKGGESYSPFCGQEVVYAKNELSNRKLDLAKFLLGKGVIPDWNALRSCVVANELELFDLYFNSLKPSPELNMEATKKEMAESMLVEAADAGGIDIVRYLLDKQADPNSLSGGQTFYAIFRAVKYPEIFKLLIANHADIRKVGYGNTTAIIHAAREGCIEVIKYLLEQHIDPYEKHGSMNAYDMAKNYNERNKSEVLALFKAVKK